MFNFSDNKSEHCLRKENNIIYSGIDVNPKFLTSNSIIASNQNFINGNENLHQTNDEYTNQFLMRMKKNPNCLNDYSRQPFRSKRYAIKQ